MSREKHLEIARELARDGEADDAYRIADRYLKEDPNDVPFLTVMTYIMMRAEKPSIAYHTATRCAQLAPKDPSVWVNMGMAAQDLWQSKEAERAYKRGLKVIKDARKQGIDNQDLSDQEMFLLVNLCALYLDTGRFDEAEPWAVECLKIDPEHRKGLANLGFCQLAQRNWAEGWKNYHECLGHDWRPKVQYNGEPEWDGSEQDTVAIYAEQGLGDVLSFASMIPDAQKKARIVLDINASLQGLLQRSFPDVKVYGTRMAKRLKWDNEDITPDASLSIGQIGEFFRLKDEDFPGTPYLIPDPDRALMWRELFKTKKKPVIGIAWSGGIPKTASRYRQLDLEQLLPVLKSVDAHWVSLQYKPAGKEIAAFKEKHPEIDLVEYPHGVLTQDYDDTAALVSALDHMIIMQTSVGHLAGGLGVPCWTFVPMTSQWRYGQEGEDFVWANSVRLIRQKERGEWKGVINKTAEELNALFPRVPKAARKTPRKRNIRSNGRDVRPSSKPDNRQAGDRQSA